jgi:hypothetical protein
MKYSHVIMMVVMGAAGLSGCQFPKSGVDPLALTGAPLTEAAWIRNGEPIQFEGENWYPMDEVENLLENEVIQVGVYREVPFYLDRADVKPFDRVYTRFLKNRFRAYEKKE